MPERRLKKNTQICEAHGGGRRAQGIAYSGKNSSLCLKIGNSRQKSRSEVDLT